MEKRKIALIITIVGLTVIILSAILLKVSDSVKETDTTILKAKILSAAKECITDKKCPTENIELSFLIENGYISDDIKEELKEYTEDSFLNYPSRSVYLIEKKQF